MPQPARPALPVATTCRIARTTVRARPRARGLTLIELMVTVAVLALLLASVAPSLGTWIGSQRVRNTASSLVAGLQQARAEAVRRNRPVSFWLVQGSSATALDNTCTVSASGRAWVIALGTASPASKCAPGTSSSQIKAALAASGGGSDTAVTVSAVDPSGSASAVVTFNGFGQVVNATPIRQIDVTGASGLKAWRVVVSSGGQAKLCEPDVTSTGDPRSCA
ncbi:MAG: GspH/FimT family pseudopilin [Aquabacterium sp.]